MKNGTKNQLSIVQVTPKNAKEETLFCVKYVKSNGFKSKCDWLGKQHKKGLTIKILKGVDGKMIGYIEYVPAQYAWRPIDADDYMFIHCIYIYSKKDRNKGFGAMLVNEAEQEAKEKGMSGVCVMTSNGAWLANDNLFINNGFSKVDQKDRFELLSKKWGNNIPDPKLIDWTAQQSKYKGWHLLYADQCPWHEKSVEALLNTAMDYGIDLKIKKLETPKEAKNSPSGFGVFSLLHNGKLLEDHYLSATRFRNILKKEMVN